MSQKLPDIDKDFANWYQEVIYQAELVDQSPVRGSMVIRPYGFAIWELIRDTLDNKIKATGHHNASFPLFIPESFLKREAKHVEGFAPELAVVTHAGGEKLEEPLVVRPTSETIIHYMFARWIKSWRDLPLKINQWANVVRWEKRPRAFLRTTEFFWQEGHTAHETREQALQEVLTILDLYVDLAQNYLAVPVVTGKKTDSERFPGAELTYTFEGVMPDGKALQMGTSHLLAGGFAESFEIRFQNREGALVHPFLTSWGATTRLVGAMVMMHGDQQGLILPPQVAPYQVVIVPFLMKDADKATIMDVVTKVSNSLKALGIRVLVDDDSAKTPGAKFYHWELRGVPMRIEIGMRDIAQNQAIVVDRLEKQKRTVSLDTIAENVQALLGEFHQKLFARAQAKQKSLWHKGEKLAQYGPMLDEQGGVYQTGWCGSAACEQELKKYKAFSRCLLEGQTLKECFNCTKPSLQDLLVAKAY
jgi:prolyl-tRNA synthetase